MDGRNPPAVAKRHKTYGDAEDTASDGDYPMLAVISPRANDCASPKRRGCAASPFLCLAKERDQRKATPLPRRLLRFSGFPGVGRGGSCPHDRRARSLARPFGLFPEIPAMLGAARGDWKPLVGLTDEARQCIIQGSFRLSYVWCGHGVGPHGTRSPGSDTL